MPSLRDAAQGLVDRSDGLTVHFTGGLPYLVVPPGWFDDLRAVLDGNKPDEPVPAPPPGAAQMAEWIAAWRSIPEQGSNTYVPRELSDSTPVHMDDYMAGYRQGASDERARLAEAVRGLEPDWCDTHEVPTVDRAAVLALLEEQP